MAHISHSLSVSFYDDDRDGVNVYLANLGTGRWNFIRLRQQQLLIPNPVTKQTLLSMQMTEKQALRNGLSE